MALENYRITEFQEKTQVDNGDYVLIDSATDGTHKYQLSRIPAQASAEVAAQIATEAAAREAADAAEVTARNAAISAAISDEVTARNAAIAANVDDTLSVSGKAADAKKTGDEIADLKSDLTDMQEEIDSFEGISEEVKQALLACFENVAWEGVDGQNYYENLRRALYGQRKVIQWKSFKEIDGSDFIIGKLAGTYSTNYITTSTLNRLSYPKFDVLTEYGYDYKFNFVASVDTVQIGTQWFNQNVLNAVQSNQNFDGSIENYDPGWLTNGSIVTPPQTFNDSTVKGLRFTSRKDTSNTNVTADMISKITVSRRPSASAISVATNFGTHQVYTTDSIESLRQFITVTAELVLGGEAEVTEYTLSGNISSTGTKTITVTYGSLTATFDVTVVANPTGIIYEWDFTKGLTDLRQAHTVKLYTGNKEINPDGEYEGTTPPILTASGIQFNDIAQGIKVFDRDYSTNNLFGKTIQVDVASFDFKGNSTNDNIRFIVFCDPAERWSTTPVLSDGLVYRKGYGWSFYDGYQWKDNIYTGMSSANAISGHKISAFLASNGAMKLYVDGSSKGTGQAQTLNNHTWQGLWIGDGSTVGAFRDALITGIRIYNGEVAN